MSFRELSVADQARAMGLSVGDTIEGTERLRNGGWTTHRLTLLWLGETEAMWSVTCRTDRTSKWSEPYESARFTLSARRWEVLRPEAA